MTLEEYITERKENINEGKKFKKMLKIAAASGAEVFKESNKEKKED